MATIEEAQFEQFVDRLGLLYFKGSEFTPYWSRRHGDVENSVPPVSLWPNIIPTIIILDKLRGILNAPIRLLSTYRSPPYNTAIGGEPASFHMKFRAIDFACVTRTPGEWANVLRSWRGKEFALPGNAGQFVFRGGIGLYNTFVHVDTRGYDANWTGS